jgi:hypothetical protein
MTRNDEIAALIDELLPEFGVYSNDMAILMLDDLLVYAAEWDQSSASGRLSVVGRSDEEAAGE